MRVGIDIDDVIYPWYRRAHELCAHAGITNGVEPVTWRPFEEYGCSLEDWVAVLVAAGRGVYTEQPYPEARGALGRLVDAGCEVVFVTARGSFGSNGAAIKGWTRDWMAEHLGDIPHELFFSPDKTAIPTDWFIDDRVDHVRDLTLARVNAYLRTQTWNAHSGLPRVDDLERFADIILGARS